MGKGLKITLGAVAALVVFGACSAAVGGAAGGSQSTATSQAPSVAAPQASVPTVTAPEVAEPQLPPGLANAVRSAENYLEFTAFSRSGLIDQLEFEGYTTDEATAAVDYINADYNAEAVESAQNYLQVTSFSRSGLIDQLEFSGFTAEQAEYGVSQAYDG